jgi:hypothetical protein
MGQRGKWERDERYRQLVELSPDAILIHDGGRIVLANAAAVRLAGATRRTQLVGLPIDTFLDPPYLKSVQTELTDAVSPAELAPPVRDTFRRVDGTRLEVEVRATAFIDHGRPSAHLVVRDITERLAVEQSARQVAARLQQAQKMEAVGALAGGVAHEVNNMMSVILGLGAFLLKDQATPAARLADVRGILKAAERAAAITRQLLDFSRTAVHRPKVVDLGSAVRHSEPVLRPLLSDGWRLVMWTDVAPRVRVDPAQLEQVIINLVLNARDATPQGGILVVTTGETEVTSGIAAADGASIPAGLYATLVVRDTGAGMDAATMARIFEPFFTTKPRGHGTGLGLAAVHGILAQNGGYITVESAPGKGSAFTLYLPALAATEMVEPEPKPPPSGADATHAGATVLVVDDEPAVRAIVARVLEQGGYRVLQAHDGAEALDAVARTGPPGLVLTDVIMPGVGGIELVRRLRERWPALPVLFISGYSAASLDGQGVIGSEEDLLQKPFSPDELLRRVTAALAPADRSQPASA